MTNTASASAAVTLVLVFWSVWLWPSVLLLGEVKRITTFFDSGAGRGGRVCGLRISRWLYARDLVDRAACLVAVCNGEWQGWTVMTVRYARNLGAGGCHIQSCLRDFHKSRKALLFFGAGYGMIIPLVSKWGGAVMEGNSNLHMSRLERRMSSTPGSLR